MTWSLEASADFEKDYRKLCGRNAAMRQAVDKKVAQLLQSPLHYKPLRAPMAGLRRVHVFGSFVLLFEASEAREVVRLIRLAHHDEAYGI